LATWIAGGVVLATLLLVRSERQPFALAFALLGFGGGGFAARALGYASWQVTLASALLACLLLAGFGYALQRLRP
jgi:hypothetical protein